MSSEIDFEKRKLLRQLPPDRAIELYLAGLEPERQKLVFAMWDMMVDLTRGVTRRAYRYNQERVLMLVSVMTDDLPELLHLAPEDQMPLELKEMFRSWISGFEHMMPANRVRSKDRKQQLMVETLLGAWMKAGVWVHRGVEWLGIEELPLEEMNPE
jgi:hypothetical protein